MLSCAAVSCWGQSLGSSCSSWAWNRGHSQWYSTAARSCSCTSSLFPLAAPAELVCLPAFTPLGFQASWFSYLESKKKLKVFIIGMSRAHFQCKYWLVWYKENFCSTPDVSLTKEHHKKDINWAEGKPNRCTLWASGSHEKLQAMEWEGTINKSQVLLQNQCRKEQQRGLGAQCMPSGAWPGGLFWYLNI